MTLVVIATELERRDWMELCAYIAARSAPGASRLREWLTSLTGVPGRIEGGGAFLGPLRYELDEHGLRWFRPGLTVSVDWNRVEQIDESDTAIFVALDPASAYVIPKRAVDATALPELVAQLRLWHAERTRTSMDEPVPAFAAVSSVAITREVTRRGWTAPPARPRQLFGLLAMVLAVGTIAWLLHYRFNVGPPFPVATRAAKAAAEVASAERIDRDAEEILFEQSDRIAAAVEDTAEERPGITDTYFLSFAGWGEQSVFRNEALFGEKVFARRFGTAQRAIGLINDENDRDTYPLASVSGLRYALLLLGDRMDKEDDVLVLFLTSHGSREEGIAVTNGSLPLVSLQPAELRSALDDSGIKWRIVIVSACYAGIFLEPLKSDATLVITAADATHTSFGCADDRDLTYFGEAFLRDSLPGSRSLEAAFVQARRLIAAREAAEKLTPSNPQIFIGPAMRMKLATPAHPIERSPVTDSSGTTLTASLQF